MIWSIIRNEEASNKAGAEEGPRRSGGLEVERNTNEGRGMGS